MTTPIRTAAAIALAAVLASRGGSSARGPDATANTVERPSSDRLLATFVRKPGDPPGVIALIRTPNGT